MNCTLYIRLFFGGGGGGFTRCRKPGCTTCPHVRNLNTVESSSNGRKLRVITNATCQTHDVVYLIECTRCQKQYIGQTSNSVHVRFQQHLRDIRTPHSQKTLPLHFTLPGHRPTDAALTVVDKSTEINARLRLEEAWIMCLGSYQPAGLNQRM